MPVFHVRTTVSLYNATDFHILKRNGFYYARFSRQNNAQIESGAQGIYFSIEAESFASGKTARS
jgi:hypothetical protein